METGEICTHKNTETPEMSAKIGRVELTVCCSGVRRAPNHYLVSSTSASDCLERLVSEMTCCVSSGT